MDSRQLAQQKIEWLLSPFSPDEFFECHFEQKPLFVDRKSMPNYYKDIYDQSDIEQLVMEHEAAISKKEPLPKEFDITQYVNGERKTLNSSEDVHSSLSGNEVWRLVNECGASLRILRPQSRSPRLRALCSLLEQAFGSGCGANVYLTPPHTQGFAPHWDDVDVFILQVSGTKQWRLHERPEDPSLKVNLPNSSSDNLTQDEVGEATQILDLSAGSLLYLPRGTIHQGFTISDEPSLHITISTAYHSSVSDFVQLALEGALAIATEDDEFLRKMMPRDYLSFFGVVHQDSTDSSVVERRGRFEADLRTRLHAMIDRIPLDAAADQMAKKFLATQLSPTCDAGAAKPHGLLGMISPHQDSMLRLVRADCARLCVEDDLAVLYHSLDNDVNVHFNEDLSGLEFELDYAPALEALLLAYPKALRVDQLPDLSLEDALDLADVLIQNKLVTIVDNISSSSSSSSG